MPELDMQRVRQDVSAAAECRTCRKFNSTRAALSSLADTDALPASVFFRVTSLLAPAHIDHVRRRHPALAEFNRRAERARQTALGMIPVVRTDPPTV